MIFHRDLRAFYRANQQEMLSLAASVLKTRDPDHCGDLVQQWYVMAIQKNVLASFDATRSNLRTWVYRSLLWCTWKEKRHARRMMRAALEESPPTPPDESWDIERRLPAYRVWLRVVARG